MPKGHYSADKRRPGYNTTKGRPHLRGNKSRTGMPRPAGSGKKNSIGDRVVLTIWLNREDRDILQSIAMENGMSVGYIIRGLISTYLEK